MPVFGAWVGVVIAFCFGSEQANKAQETLVKALSPQDEKLSEVKVRNLLDKFAVKPKTVKLTDKIKDVLAAFSGLSDLQVIGEDGKPLGILYKQEIVSTLPKLNEKGTLDPDPDPNKDENNKKLKDKLSEINNHLLIPNRKWASKIATTH